MANVATSVSQIRELVRKTQGYPGNSQARTQEIQKLVINILRYRSFCRFNTQAITDSDANIYAPEQQTPKAIYAQIEAAYKQLKQEVEAILEQELQDTIDQFNPEDEHLLTNLINLMNQFFAQILKQGGLNIIAKQAKATKILQNYLTRKSPQPSKQEFQKVNNLFHYTINELFQAILLSKETQINRWQNSSETQALDYQSESRDIAFKETTIFICNNIDQYDSESNFIQWFANKLKYKELDAYQEIKEKFVQIYDLENLDQEVQNQFSKVVLEIKDNQNYISSLKLEELEQKIKEQKASINRELNEKQKKELEKPQKNLEKLEKLQKLLENYLFFTKKKYREITFLQFSLLRLQERNWSIIAEQISNLGKFDIKDETCKKQFSQWLKQWLKKENKISSLESGGIISLTELENLAGEDTNIFESIDQNLSEIDHEDDSIDSAAFFLEEDFDKVENIMSKKISGVTFKTMLTITAQGYSLKEIAEKFSLNYNSSRSFYNRCIKDLTKLYERKQNH